MTRNELGNVLSAQIPTRTTMQEGYEGEITEESEVVFIDVDEKGVINIHCIPNTK